MEGQENLRQLTLKQELSQHKQSVKLVIIFHLVGLAGFLVPGLNFIFLKLVPWHLLFMFLILLYSHQNGDKKFIAFITITYLLGFAAEWMGVNRHWLFGDYAYGKTLGVGFYGVPLIIGVNWFLLTYSAGVLMQRSRLRSPLIRIIAGASLLVLLDLLIEPVAIRFDYWHWVDRSIPLKNYGCWFGISILMLALFELFRFKKQNIVAPVFLLTQFIFFAVLYFAG
jgi:bisanhydrobacterioruberin hydratase